jgi:hypothetical protein
VAPSHFATTPVTSDIAALIFGGEYDPVTTPAWGRHARATLANGFFVELPNETHGSVATACSAGVMLAFLRDPRRLPDLACVMRTPMLPFD